MILSTRPKNAAHWVSKWEALTHGSPGIYNIAEDDGEVVIDKARRELGFDPGYRLRRA